MLALARAFVELPHAAGSSLRAMLALARAFVELPHAAGSSW